MAACAALCGATVFAHENCDATAKVTRASGCRNGVHDTPLLYAAAGRLEPGSQNFFTEKNMLERTRNHSKKRRSPFMPFLHIPTAVRSTGYAYGMDRGHQRARTYLCSNCPAVNTPRLMLGCCMALRIDHQVVGICMSILISQHAVPRV